MARWSAFGIVDHGSDTYGNLERDRTRRMVFVKGNFNSIEQFASCAEHQLAMSQNARAVASAVMKRVGERLALRACIMPQLERIIAGGETNRSDERAALGLRRACPPPCTLFTDSRTHC